VAGEDGLHEVAAEHTELVPRSDVWVPPEVLHTSKVSSGRPHAGPYISRGSRVSGAQVAEVQQVQLVSEAVPLPSRKSTLAVGHRACATALRAAMAATPLVLDQVGARGLKAQDTTCRAWSAGARMPMWLQCPQRSTVCPSASRSSATSWPRWPGWSAQNCFIRVWQRARLRCGCQSQSKPPVSACPTGRGVGAAGASSGPPRAAGVSAPAGRVQRGATRLPIRRWRRRCFPKRRSGGSMGMCARAPSSPAG
jgi:hypothetical protein